MQFTFKHLHNISPNIDEAFKTFYETLLKDMHFSNFFDNQEQVEFLIEKQKIFFTKALSMPIEDMKKGYIKLGEYHHKIRIPYIDFMKGMEILEESFLMYSQTQGQSIELMEDIFKYFKLIKAQTAKGYLNEMLDEDGKDIEVFFENITNEENELSKDIVFERISWLKSLIDAIKHQKDFNINERDLEFKSWIDSMSSFDKNKKEFIEDLEKRININTQNLFYFLKKGDFLEILPLYSSLLGIYKLTLLLSNTVSITMTDEIVSSLRMDKLTNLFRKDAFEQFLEKEIEAVKRNKSLFSVVFIDVDDFKFVNDNYGHWSGDKVLENIGAAINKKIRSSDIGFRIGGDEFAIILKDATAKQALQVCRSIRSEISEFEFIYNDQKSFYVDVSIGIYECNKSSQSCNVENIVKNVDKALYNSKKDGKSKISIF
ncbi:diguanylate cyclase [Sulfurimonas sp.]